MATALINEKEAELLAAIQHRANQPLTEIAEEIGMSLPKARYALRTLIDKRIVTGVFPFVNLCRLGYTNHALLFSVSCETARERDAIAQHMRTANNIVWCGEFSGEFRFGMTIAARTPLEVAESLTEVSTKFGAVINKKEVSTKLRMFFYPNKQLAPLSAASNITFAYSCEAEGLQLDSTRSAILREMVKGHGASMRDIGAQIGLPVSTVHRKIQSLEQEGIIGGYYYGIDQTKLGFQEHVLLVYSRGQQPEVTKKLHAFAASSPYISFLVEAHGSWDYEIGVTVQSGRELTATIDAIHDLAGTRLTQLRPVQITKTLRRCDYPFRPAEVTSLRSAPRRVANG